MKILVTGAAGFIGFHLCKALLESGYDVVGLDNLNDYYDVGLKKARLKELGISSPYLKKSTSKKGFLFYYVDIANMKALNAVFESHQFELVFHLAAQAGVRYSIDNPAAYVQSNLVGFANIIEAVRNFGISKLVYASSSSVYGANTKIPFSVGDKVDYPVSLYAATKKANELMAHSYSHLYGIKTVGLRFFTVYGPWGRPDMAYYSFAQAIMAGKSINVFNHGNMMRDFTYINDIVDGLMWFAIGPNWHKLPDEANIFNFGNNKPVKLGDFISILEKKIEIEVEKNYLPMQDGDVVSTWADIGFTTEVIGFHPSTNLDKGLGDFVNWLVQYHKKEKNKSN